MSKTYLPIHSSNPELRFVVEKMEPRHIEPKEEYLKYLDSAVKYPFPALPEDCPDELIEGVHFRLRYQHCAFTTDYIDCSEEVYHSLINKSYGRIIAVPLSVKSGEEIPTWYTKEQMYDWLITENYSKEIATELSEAWARDLQGAFKKGWEKATNDGKFLDRTEYKYMPDATPTKSDEVERRFTMQEILTYGAVCAVKGRDMNPVDYFREKFNVDITKDL